jgi:DNA modification methylase
VRCNTTRGPASVWEPFGGSGWTLIACDQTDRRCFMIELGPLYCDVILQRWEDFTGRKAQIVEQERVTA